MSCLIVRWRRVNRCGKGSTLTPDSSRTQPSPNLKVASGNAFHLPDGATRDPKTAALPPAFPVCDEISPVDDKAQVQRDDL